MRLVCVPDEESEELDERSTDAVVARGLGGEFAITGEPTDMHIGIQAKGVLVMRIVVHGRAAHSSTPWLGDNAVLKAIDMFRAIETLPFSASPRRCSTGRRSISGGSRAAMRSTRSPTAARWRSTSATCPARTRGRSSPRSGRSPISRSSGRSSTASVGVSRHNPYVHALSEAVARATRGEVMSVGRDGASDAASFIEAGIPAVEFGPAGGGHHGPDEWVSLQSLASYRQALAGVRARAARLAGAVTSRRQRRAAQGSTAIEGGLA